MADKIVTAVENGGKAFNEYEVYCKLNALAFLLGAMRGAGCSPSEHDCYGFELLLQGIANEVDPSKKRQEITLFNKQPGHAGMNKDKDNAKTT